MDFLHSIEFYVILVIAAAAVVALAARPRVPGAVKEHLLAGELIPPAVSGDSEPPSIEISCADSGRIILVRRGLQDISISGAVSLAMKVKGFDIRIEERLTPGSPYDDPAETAMFTIDSLAPHEYYHIHYDSDSIGRSATFTFHTRPGIKATYAMTL